ncbi:MAG: 2-succinyl-5-enolpyruvyl-6-hydroxy-3-cyclohexene-1-carboxylic-acid synthase [Candidatus Promineifilaceae bacterium]
MTAPIHNSQFTIHNSQFSNPSLLWSQIFVNALAQGGLKQVCIAPGSRSTPLTLAFDHHPDIQVYLHLDERSAAFFALGMALATEKPVALVCTSGSAAANFFPALVEAKMSGVPLLLLTTDRPHELRHSGANQTIDQVKLYGDQVLWSVDMPIPQADAPDVALRNLHTLATRALAVADGLVKGPVHVNFPFRKPLEPETGDWRPETGVVSSLQSLNLSVSQSLSLPISQVSRGRIHPTPEQISRLSDLIRQHPRGLIVCGPRCPGGEFPDAVRQLSQMIGYPLLADPLSGLRFGVPESIGGYDTFPMGDGPGWPEPQVIIRFGQVPTSKWLNEYLDKITPTHRLHIRANGIWADDSHRTTWFLQADEAVTCRELVGTLGNSGESGQWTVDSEQLTVDSQQSAVSGELSDIHHSPFTIHHSPFSSSSPWSIQVEAKEHTHWQALHLALSETWFDGAAVAEVVAVLPEGANLFMGNSLAIRHLDQFGAPTAKRFQVFGNRGASGIDGNVSSALGIAAAFPHTPLVAIIGDITFYHDLNGLLAVKQHQLNNITFVLLNNNGGGIFRRLPIAKIEPPFTELFLTPHGLQFGPVVEMYGLKHELVRGRDAFRTALHTSLTSTHPTVIELQTDSAEDLRLRQEAVRKVNS